MVCAAVEGVKRGAGQARRASSDALGRLPFARRDDGVSSPPQAPPTRPTVSPARAGSPGVAVGDASMALASIGRGSRSCQSRSRVQALQLHASSSTLQADF